MLRIEAWSVIDGLHIAVHGVAPATTPRPEGGSGRVAVTFVPSKQIEEYGLEAVLRRAIQDVASVDFGILEYALY